MRPPDGLDETIIISRPDIVLLREFGQMRRDTTVMPALALLGGPPAVIDPPRSPPLPPIEQSDIEQIIELISRREISTSPIVRKFEQHVQDAYQTRFAIACNNGTGALLIALFAVGVGPGDEVLVPSYTFMATASPLTLLRARPVFVDVDPDTWVVDSKVLKSKLTPRTRALVAVHSWGNVAPMDELVEFAAAHGLRVVSDCSHAHGARFAGRPVGAWGDVAAFSLQGNKLVSGGEGGLVTTSNPDLYERVVALGHFERLPSLPDASPYRILEGTGLGIKLRIHPLAAAMAAGQLERLPSVLESRARNANRFIQGVTSLGVSVQSRNDRAESVFYRLVGMWPGLRTLGVPIETILTALQAEGVPARRLPFGGLHHTPLFRIPDVLDQAAAGSLDRSQCLPAPHLPVTDHLVEEVFELLPIGHEDDAQFVDQVIGAYHKLWDHRTTLASLPVKSSRSQA